MDGARAPLLNRSVRPLNARRFSTPINCSACGKGYDSLATSCPAYSTPAGAVASRVGPFALVCLHLARVATLINVFMLLPAGGMLALNGHYFLTASLVLFGVPVSIGHFVAFGLVIDYAHTQ